MKKRFFAAFTALVLILSVFAFASCDNETATDTSSEASAEESVKELTPKELFTSSLFKTVADSQINGENTSAEIFDMIMGNTKPKDSVGEISFKIDKLNIEGATLDLFGGDVSVSADIAFDADTQLSKIDYELSFMGEKPTAGILYDNANKKIFITDLFDSLEKPLLAISAETGIDAYNFDTEVVKYIFDSAVNAFGNNIKDDMFTSETKDVTVDGNSYNGATVITLTVPKEAAIAIAKEFTDSLLKNETIKPMLPDGLTVVEDGAPESIKLINTVVDEKSVALDVEIKLGEKTTEIVETSIIVGEESEDDEDEGPEFDTIVIHTSYVGDNFKLEVGPVDAEGNYFDEHGYIAISYTLDGENEKFVFGGMEDGEKVEIIKIEGTNKNGEHKGTASLGTERDNVSFPYAYVENGNNYSFEIGPFESNGSGETEKLDLKLTANYTLTDTKVSLNGTVSFKESTNEIALTFTETLEYKDVTLEAITDYIEIEEFDESKIENAFKEKCPTLYQMVKGSNEELVSNIIDDRFVLCLPEGFEEKSAAGYTAVFDSEEVAVLVLEEKFDDIGVELTLEEYITIIRNNVQGNVSEIYGDDLPYFIYENSEYGMHYLITAYEGEDSFWLVQFCCSEDNFNDYHDRFLAWAYGSGVVYIELVDESF